MLGIACVSCRRAVLSLSGKMWRLQLPVVVSCVPRPLPPYGMLGGEVTLRPREKGCTLEAYVMPHVRVVIRTLVMLHSLCCFPIRSEEKESDLGALLLCFQVRFLLFYLSTSPQEQLESQHKSNRQTSL